MMFDPSTARPEQGGVTGFDPLTAVPEKDIQLRAQLRQARETDPLKVVMSQIIAQDMGLPPPVVQRNFDTLKGQHEVETAAARLEKLDPHLAYVYAMNRDFAARAHLDTDALIKTHDTISNWVGPEATITNIAKGLGSSLVQAGIKTKLGLTAQMSDFLRWAGMMPEDPVAQADQLRKLDQAQTNADFTRPQIDSRTGRMIYGGAESTVQQLPGLVASVLTGNPLPSLALAGVQTQTDAYGKYRARGGDPLESFLGATGEGTVEVATEFLPTQFLVDALGNRGVGELMKGLFGREIVGEEAATFLQDALDTAIANPDKTWGEFFAERPGAAYDTFVATATQTLLMGGMGALVNRVTGQTDRIAEAEQMSKRLKTAMQAAATVQMREHSPKEFAGVMQSLADAEDGTRSSVFIDAEVLAQSGINVAEVLPSVAGVIEEAAIARATVEVPIGELLAAAPGTPLEDLFMQNGKSSPTAMSLVEAQEASAMGEQFFQQEAQRVLKQAADTQAWQKSVDAVQQAVLADLNATGRFTPAVNESYARLQAAFFSTMASRYGTTPEELFSRYRLRTQGQQGQQGAVLNSGAPGSDIRDGITIGELFGAVDELSAIADIPLRFDLQGSQSAAVYDPRVKAIRFVPAALNVPREQLVREVLHEASHALDDTNGRLNNSRYADMIDIAMRDVTITPEMKTAYEEFTSFVVENGGDMDKIPPLRELILDDNVQRDIEDILDLVKWGDDVALQAERLADAAANLIYQAGNQSESDFTHTYPGETDAEEFANRMMERLGAATNTQANFNQPATYDFDEGAYRPEVVAWAREKWGDAVAPNGKPVWQNFVRWFGDSKVVDENGAPLVVYHGTRADFDVFRTNNYSPFGEGAFFTSDPEVASIYAENAPGDGAPRVIPVYLRITGDNDGAIRDSGIMGISFTVKSPEQIKSATGNRGTFDPNDPSVLNQTVDGTSNTPAKKVDNLQMVAERGQRVVGKIGHLSEDEKKAVRSSAEVVGMSEKDIIKVIRAHKAAHLVTQGWAPLVYLRSTIEDGKVTHEYKTIPYAFNVGGDGKSLKPGTPEYIRRVAALAKAMTDEVRRIAARAADGDPNAKNILAQAGWYKSLRSSLRKEFGGLGDLFADLLGATSPNTPVRDNWSNAVDSLRRAMRGDFDKLIPQWEALFDKVDALENEARAWINETLQTLEQERQATEPDRKARIDAIDAEVDAARKEYESKRAAEEKETPTGEGKDGAPKQKTLSEIRQEQGWKDLNRNADKKAIRDEARRYSRAALFETDEYLSRIEAIRAAREFPDELLPTKENDKKYGFNGRNVARAMVDLWRVVRNADADIARGGTAPKAINFSGNLIGFRERATIDVWAARMLQRLAGKPRIPSMAEGGVSGEMREDGSTTLQFGFGQDVFSEAVKLIRADDELNKNKTLAEINDDDLQAVVWFVEKELWTVNNWTNAAGEGGSFELEASLAGPKDQARIRELRRVLDSTKSTQEQKAQARAELAGMERTVDRFVGGLSIQMAAGTQGVDFVPTDSDMARLGEAIRTAIYEADNGATVLGSKALSTEGRYGGIERSLDLEVIAREGYDASALWLEMLRQAQAARQDSTFLSRVLRDDEDPDPLRHRPGVEIYFRDAAARDKLEGVLAELAGEGVEYLTVVVDGRRSVEAISGGMPAAVGVRLQFIPEFLQRYGDADFTGLDDAAIAAKIKEQAGDLKRLAARVSAAIEGVSFAGQFWYDTEVAFSSEYQEKIDALTTGTAEGRSSQARGRVWAGQPVRAGIESANRQARETASREPGADVLGGDALGQTDALNAKAASGDPLGTFSPSQLLISLSEKANLSTFLHESGHFFLEVLADLAADPASPQQVKDDFATFLKWAGIPDLATWQGMTLDEKRPHHERWAESFEQYLFEGKAPSLETQGLFRQFRQFMVRVYKSLLDFMQGRNLQVSPEIRQVFDRMLATDEAIAEAERTAGMLPDFDATNEAIEKLQAASLANVKWISRAKTLYLKQFAKDVAALRKQMTSQVRAEIEQQQVYRAMRWLRRGEMTNEAGEEVKVEKGFRLNTDALAEMYPESMLARPNIDGLKGMTSKTGLHPDLVAEMFGYDSGDALVRTVLEARPLNELIEETVDQRMLEEHGDKLDIEELANQAVHNEARARAIAAELKAQAEAMNPREDTGRANSKGRRITVNALVAAAKQFAENLTARRVVKDLKNAAHQHRAAEARAAKAWEKATKAGKTEEAIQAQRDKLLNNASARSLQDAQTEVQEIKAFFARILKGTNERMVKGGRDPDVVNAMRAILGMYGVAPKKAKGAAEYLEIVKRSDPEMFAALADGVQFAMQNAKPIDQLTMEELRNLNEELQAMWTLAKRSRQIEVDGKLVPIEEAEEALLARMTEVGIPDSVPGENRALTPRDAAERMLQHAGSLMRRVEQWAEGMDGKFGGPFLRYLFRRVKEAGDAYRADRVVYRRKLQDLVDQVAPHMPKGPIAAPELGYTFGLGHNGIGMAELLHVILHTGNDSNKRKLLLGGRPGNPWATLNEDGTLNTGPLPGGRAGWDAFIQRMHNEGVLTKEHYDFAQGVWDLLEETKPGAQKTHREVFGRYFAEVTANAFDTPFGQYRGGYVPAQADPRLVQDAEMRKLAEAENESMAFSFPSTNRGFTKGRVDYNRPLMLDLRTIGKHIDKVLLFTHMEPAVRDVQRILSRKGVSGALNRIDPTVYAGMLTPWLNRSARQMVETPIVGDGGLSRIASVARNRAGMALMFGNISNGLQQTTGFLTAMSKLKADGLDSHMMRTAAQYLSNPKAMTEAVANASTFMAGRMENEIAAMQDAMNDIMLNPSTYESAQAWSQRHSYFLQTAFANTMEPIIWTAGYNAAISKGMDTKEAARYADSLIRQTQGSTLPEDVSRVETGPAVLRLVSQFIGYFNMMANTNATAVKQIAQDVGLRKGAGKLFAVVLLGGLAPLWVAEAIAVAMRGGPDDEDDDGYLDDWIAAVLGMGTIKGLLAMVPFVGQFAVAGLNKFNDNPMDDRVSMSPAVSLLEGAVGVPYDVYRVIEGKGDARKLIRDTASLLSLATGIPVTAAARPLGYIGGVAQGKIEPTGPLDFARGMVTGAPSPASKQ